MYAGGSVTCSGGHTGTYTVHEFANEFGDTGVGGTVTASNGGVSGTATFIISTRVMAFTYTFQDTQGQPVGNLKPGDKFDIKWTILNTGTKTMRDGLDVSYNQGPKLTTVSRVELPELEPGDQFDLRFDAVAPNKEGSYIMTFIVEGGLCYPYVAIKVER